MLVICPVLNYRISFDFENGPSFNFGKDLFAYFFLVHVEEVFDLYDILIAFLALFSQGGGQVNGVEELWRDAVFD